MEELLWPCVCLPLFDGVQAMCSQERDRISKEVERLSSLCPWNGPECQEVTCLEGTASLSASCKPVLRMLSLVPRCAQPCFDHPGPRLPRLSALSERSGKFESGAGQTDPVRPRTPHICDSVNCQYLPMAAVRCQAEMALLRSEAEDLDAMLREREEVGGARCSAAVSACKP